jgi:uridylate kinase
MRYRRVVIKLSGAALSGSDPVGLDASALEHVADEVLAVAADALMVAKNGVDGVYTVDPSEDPEARRYDCLSFNDAIAKDLRVMDPSAFILARDHDLPLHVFDIARTGAMTDILKGEVVGTEISNAA